MEYILIGFSKSIIQTCLSYPFDKYKSHLQINNSNNKSFYFSGISIQILLKSFKRGQQFYVFNNIKNNNPNIKYINYKAGFITGLISSLYGTPLNFIKINKQIYNNNILDFIKSTYKNNGLFGFYHAYKINTLREVIINTSYLGNYFTCNEFLNKYYNKNKSLNILYSSFLAYTTTWFFAMPFDYLTNNKQLHNHINYKSLIYNYKKLWNGYFIIVLPSLPINIISMYFYEYIMNIYIYK
jgi:hypothetical protein